MPLVVPTLRHRDRRPAGVAFAAVILLSGCFGSDSKSSATTVAAAATTAPAGTTVGSTADTAGVPALAAADVESVCAPMFESWFGGDADGLSSILDDTAISQLNSHPYVDGVYGLAGNGTDCFITQSDDTGAVTQIGDVTFTLFEGDAQGTGVDWYDLASAPDDVAARFVQATTLYVPASSSDEGGAPSPADSSGGSTATTSAGGASDAEIQDLQASCVYGADSQACNQLAAAGFPADTNYGLGNSLSQAPDAGLVDDCGTGSQLACLELESRYPATAADAKVADGFVAAIIAGKDAGAFVGDGVLAQIPEALQGPFGPSGDVEIPGTNFTNGFLQFTIAPTVFVDCYVGGGLVRHCQVEAD